ncbi:MAG: hypothetical protein ACRDV8_07275 [Acidimicrobiales bacterium]
MTSGAGHRGSARSVVPVRGGVKLRSAPIKADQQLLDQQSIVEDDIHY